MTDRIEQHYGQQLSALMDGELAPDQARFLLRRLGHDRELADSWERWQLAGEVLRGRAVAPLSGGFAERVGEALAAQRGADPGPRHAPVWLRWSGGAALAASAAVVALLAGRPAPDQAPGAEVVVATPATAGPGVAAPSTEVPAVVVAVPGERPVVAALETASAPARPSSGRPIPRAARSRPAPPAASVPAMVAAAPVEALPAERDPFAGDIVTRPWPRAVLPQFGSGALATGSGSGAPQAAPSFYPFDPRPADAEAGAPPSDAGQAPAQAAPETPRMP